MELSRWKVLMAVLIAVDFNGLLLLKFSLLLFLLYLLSSKMELPSSLFSLLS